MRASQLILERRHSYLSEPLLVDNYQCEKGIGDYMLNSNDEGEWLEYYFDDDNDDYPKITDL